MPLDPANQCPKEYCRLTFDKFPESENVRQRAGGIPLAAIYRPFCDLEGSTPVPIVNFGNCPVVRCRRCRSYVSPFAFFIENGRRWQCALCWNVNDVEPDYYCPLNPETGKRQDANQRPELYSGIIDIIAPDEYTIRPPTPPAFLFVIDVSRDAVQSGLLQAVSIGIKRCLSRLPGHPRTQVGFITFDSEIHFYDLSGGPEGKGGPRMLVVSDLAQMFHPTASDDILVDLVERRQAIDTLLDQLPTMHAGLNSESALGPALEAAYDIIAPLGGKLSVFQVQLPMMVDTSTANGEKEKDANTHGGLPKPGRGADGRALGGPNEHDFLQPANVWYMQKAENFCRQHISLDWYCCTSQYCDLATCAELCHLTAGRLRYYPRFHAAKDGERLTQDIFRSLTTVCATEAVMRVRASSGVKVTRFHGSFTMRARDLLSLPQSDPDGVEGFEFAFEEELIAGKFIALQSAVLYTTMDGERRIRVTNQAVPLTNNPGEVAQGMQPDVVSAILFKRAVADVREPAGGLDQARNQLKVAFWRFLEVPGMAQNHMALVDTLARNTVGMIKSAALRGGTDIGFDERYHLLRLVGRSSIDRLERIMRPKLYELSFQGGTPKELPLTRQSLTAESLLLLDNGIQCMIWIGSRCNPQVFLFLFGSDQAAKTDPSMLRLIPPAAQGDSPVKQQVWSLLSHIRKSRPEDFVPVVIIREGDATVEPRFYWSLVNDPATFRGGEITVEDLISRGSKVASGAARPPGAPGPMGPVGAAPPAAPGVAPTAQPPLAGMARPPQVMGALSPMAGAPRGPPAAAGGGGMMPPPPRGPPMPMTGGGPAARPPASPGAPPPPGGPAPSGHPLRPGMMMPAPGGGAPRPPPSMGSPAQQPVGGMQAGGPQRAASPVVNGPQGPRGGPPSSMMAAPPMGSAQQMRPPSPTNQQGMPPRGAMPSPGQQMPPGGPAPGPRPLGGAPPPRPMMMMSPGPGAPPPQQMGGAPMPRPTVAVPPRGMPPPGGLGMHQPHTFQ